MGLDPYRLAATYVDRILRGAKPADLPMQLPTSMKPSSISKPQSCSGLKSRPSLLIRADEVIE